MSVKVEKIEGGTPHTTIMVAGLIASVVLIYLTYLNVLTGTQFFSFFGVWRLWQHLSGVATPSSTCAATVSGRVSRQPV